ncbi:MAG: HAMP domain-containing histidine kinase [Deltaproteobacteria bacterium]|nr:HAMP domain-containing histidine kinase [Deltaproteobacteria bacterium]
MTQFLNYLNINSSSGFWEFSLWVFVIVFSTLVGSLVIARIISAPISRMGPMVERLSNGELDSRIDDRDTRRGDEFGALSRLFNQMAANIARLFENERSLLRDISHDLRSPLTRAKIALSLIRRNSARLETIEKSLTQLEKDIDRADYMIGELLERARMLTQTDTDFKKQLFDFAYIAKESVADLSFETSTKTKIIYEGLDSAPYYGNHSLIRRAIANILRNSLNHAPSGSAITARLWRVSGVLIFEVTDEGPGVPTEYLRNIFLPFFRISASGCPRGRGFGLGLNIVEQAARLHGGKAIATNLPPKSHHIARGLLAGGLKVSLILPIMSDTSDTTAQK